MRREDVAGKWDHHGTTDHAQTPDRESPFFPSGRGRGMTLSRSAEVARASNPARSVRCGARFLFAAQAMQTVYCTFAWKDALGLSWGRLCLPNTRMCWVANRFGAEHG